MASIESLLISVSILVLGITIIYFGSIVKERNSTMAAQLRLEQINFINDLTADKALTEILWVWEWTDFDDYWSKYSPRANPEANITRRIARNYYVALASMVKRGDLAVELLYELNPSGVTRYWEKIGPIALEFRKRNNYPDYLEPIEYLALRINEHRESIGLSNPSQVK
jgi:hypothetical protein